MALSIKTLQWLGPAVLFGMIALLGTSDEAFAQTPFKSSTTDHPCSESVEEKLIELGIDLDDVKGISIYRREVRRQLRNRVRRQLKGYRAWVMPLDEKGNLVMDLFLNCQVQRVYTRGGFILPGGDGDVQ